MSHLVGWLWNILISIDQLANAIFGGDPDETISSRIGKRVVSGKARWYEIWLAKMLHIIDPNHVQDAIEPDEGDRDWKK